MAIYGVPQAERGSSIKLQLTGAIDVYEREPASRNAVGAEWRNSTHDGETRPSPNQPAAYRTYRPQEVIQTATPHVPCEDAKKLYGEFMAETNKRELSGSDNFDKSVLTLSSAGLGLSVSFLKDLVGASVVLPLFLYTSWILFVFATVSTMLSFIVSGKALGCQKELAHRAYIQGEVEAFDAPNKWNQRTIYLNYVSAIAFCIALILTTAFVITNLQENSMATNTYKPTTSTSLEHKGATVPTMQRPASAPATTPTQPASAPATQNGGANGSSKHG